MRAAIGDRRRVEQVLTNLGANAVKYGADGGVVELAGWFDGAHAIVAVRDEGPGIAADERHRIFERFYRTADHGPVTGTGLGLSIARDLARAMSGELDVASLPGTGSSFVLVLPGVGPASGETSLAAIAGEALSFEADRLDALSAVRAAGRRPVAPGAPGARTTIDGSRTAPPMSSGLRR
jgi:anti-sigma regulatory factor (Ser/Thr protein kinase)